MVTTCLHYFCEKCIEDCLKAKRECPICRTKLPMNNDIKHTTINSSESFEKIKETYKRSSKTKAFLSSLQAVPDGEKSIVFT